jgi:hypothetical protein
MDINDFNSLFSPSLDDTKIDDKINQEALFEKIRASLSSILFNTFGNNIPKLEILERDNRLNFACPSCGDSKNNNSKKRGNIYYNGFNFKCYNSESEFCGQTRTIKNFLSKFGKIDDFTSAELLYLEQNTTEHHQLTVSSSGVNFNSYATDMFGIEEYAIPRKDLMACKQVEAPFGMMDIKLVEISDNMKIFNYLRNRKQIPPNGDTRHFAYDSYNDNLYTFNLTHGRDKIIGLQVRRQNLKSKKDLRFISYKYSDIWDKFFGVKEIKENIKNAVDQYSLLYNILNVNFNKDINSFEGAIDSHHMHNSIATLSASTKIYLENGKYFYDNATIDPAGRKAALDMIGKGYSIFLWSKFLDDYPVYRECKDLNDIMCKLPIKEEILKKYYSDHSLDAIYL